MLRSARFLVIPFLAALVLVACGRSQEATGSPGARSASSASGSAVASPAPRLEPNPAYMEPGDTRTFSVTYTAEVRDVPAGTKTLRVWVPVPVDTSVQTITNVRFAGPVQPRITTERRFGDKLAYYEVAGPGATFQTNVSYTVTRKETKMNLDELKTDGTESDPSVKEFLKPDKLVIVDARIKKIADEATAGKTSTLEKAHALYDYVADHMAYDKSGAGWGHGDTNFACDVGRGNCTDFHSLFISLCRAEGIPAGFGIGLFPPYEHYTSQPLGGYHCWAYFRVPGKSWVPVDISEGWKENGKRRAYFFGNHTSNRVTLSFGRDLVLEPKQAGEPVNYLLNPYAEADGKPVSTSKSWTMKDLP